MTPEEKHLEKCQELLEGHSERVMEVVKRLYNCGGIDTESYSPDEYILAKIITTAALRDCCEVFRPLNNDHKKALNNLKHF